MKKRVTIVLAIFVLSLMAILLTACPMGGGARDPALLGSWANGAGEILYTFKADGTATMQGAPLSLRYEAANGVGSLWPDVPVPLLPKLLLPM